MDKQEFNRRNAEILRKLRRMKDEAWKSYDEHDDLDNQYRLGFFQGVLQCDEFIQWYTGPINSEVETILEGQGKPFE